MGILTGVYGLVSGLLALRAFAERCWRAQPESFILEQYPELGELGASFGYGPGAVLMFVATALKAIDVACHALVPTPAARHAKPPADADGPLPQYLRSGGLDAPTRWGYGTAGGRLLRGEDGDAHDGASSERGGVELKPPSHPAASEGAGPPPAGGQPAKAKAEATREAPAPADKVTSP